jgi:hypothetical protein
VAQLNRGRVSVPAQAALSGSHRKAPGSAGGYLLWKELSYDHTDPLQYFFELHFSRS